MPNHDILEIPQFCTKPSKYYMDFPMTGSIPEIKLFPITNSNLVCVTQICSAFGIASLYAILSVNLPCYNDTWWCVLPVGGCAHVDGLTQDCSNSSALAMELRQSFAKPPIWAPLKGPYRDTKCVVTSGSIQIFIMTCCNSKVVILMTLSVQWSCCMCYHCNDK